MKICPKCKINKPLDGFAKSSKRKDGLQYECRECVAAYHAYYYMVNRKAFKAYCAANADRKAEYDAEYRSRNHEKTKAYRAANSEKAKAYGAAYRLANPDKAAAHNRNRRAIKRSAEGKHTAADVRAIFENQKGLCANCQTKLFKSGKHKFHADHIMPLALGGSNWPSNLQCLCQSCNLRKWAKHPDDWAKENGRLV